MNAAQQNPKAVPYGAPYGTRYPVLGFPFSGIGVSSIGHEPHPYETISFDEALVAAKIQNFNIVTYTSVLPPELVLKTLDEVRSQFHHGAVLEVIMAGIGVTYSEGGGSLVSIRRHGQQYVRKVDTAVKAVAASIGVLTECKNQNGKVVGGYVAEYVGIFDSHVGRDKAQAEAGDQLNESMDHILSARKFPVKDNGSRAIHQVAYTEVDANDKFGYALNGLGFLQFANV